MDEPTILNRIMAYVEELCYQNQDKELGNNVQLQLSPFIDLDCNGEKDTLGYCVEISDPSSRFCFYQYCDYTLENALEHIWEEIEKDKGI